MELKYRKGSEHIHEAVELTIDENVYLINANLLICGINEFSDANKTSIKLNLNERKKILEFIKEERNKIINKTSPKSLESWHECGFESFEDYFRPGDAVTEDLVEYFVNVVPPVSCSSGYVQAGSAYSHTRDSCGTCRATYITFKKNEGNWTFLGYCFKHGIENVVVCHNRLENAIFDTDYLIRFEEYKTDNIKS